MSKGETVTIKENERNDQFVVGLHNALKCLCHLNSHRCSLRGYWIRKHRFTVINKLPS